MSNKVKNMSVIAGIALETPSLADDELKKLESCIDLLVGVTNSLNAELKSTNNKLHYVRCAKAIQSNIETIRRLTLSIYDIKIKGRKVSQRDIIPSGWEIL